MGWQSLNQSATEAEKRGGRGNNGVADPRATPERAHKYLRVEILTRVMVLRIDKMTLSQVDDLERGDEGPLLGFRRPKTYWFWNMYKMIWALFLSLLVFLKYSYSAPLPVFSHGGDVLDGVPSFVIDYAPLVYLDKDELYFPSDILSQISNTNPEVNFSRVTNAPSPLTGHNLDALNSYGNDGSKVYLTSTIDITKDPSYLFGVKPDASGRTENAISCAIIVNDRGAGFLDAFYMYFYAYNQGNTVLGNELGDHVGDWEHNMIRFVDGKPTAVWYSQHENGQAFIYDVVEKVGQRPVTYSARGSHANYAIVGTHGHAIPNLNLPFGVVEDYTSKGLLWDPTLSSYMYGFNDTTSHFSSIGLRQSPLGIMHYKGKWGDQQYRNRDPRQKRFFGFHKYTSGPTGPQDKQLNRKKVCPDNGILCVLRTKLGS